MIIDKENDMAVFMDIETLDFFSDPAIAILPRAKQIQAMRFGLAVTIDDRQTSGPELWIGADVCRSLWDYLLQADLVVGWNILDFDYNIIRRMASACPTNPNTCDMFDRIRMHTGRWYKLGDCAEANGVGEKSADGQQAAQWLRAGEWQRAAEYCEQDVRLTQRLYDLARTDGLYLPARPGRKRPEIENFRIWIDGERWRLRNEDSGKDFREAWDVK
jgi:hypothetical protein